MLTVSMHSMLNASAGLHLKFIYCLHLVVVYVCAKKLHLHEQRPPLPLSLEKVLFQQELDGVVLATIYSHFQRDFKVLFWTYVHGFVLLVIFCSGCSANAFVFLFHGMKCRINTADRRYWQGILQEPASGAEGGGAGAGGWLAYSSWL